MRKSQRVLALALVGALGLTAAACGSGKKTSSPTTTAGGGATTTAASGGGGGGGVALKLGVAYDTGGRGDGTFNDAAGRGADQAKKELGAQVDELEAKSGEDRGPNLTALTQNGDSLVIAVGFLFESDLDKVAAANPKTNYGIVDSCPATPIPNVACMVFSEEQGSFLVGAAAALKSKTGHIGFIGGQEIDLIKKFEAGYIAGAKAVRPDIKVQIKYLTSPPDFSGFRDPAKGKTAAEGMFDAGADIVYHAAGGSGGGVFEAAKAAGGQAIGVDQDQALTASPAVRGVIMTSMIKRVEVATFDFIKQVNDGTFKAGSLVYDLKANGVDYSTTGGKVADIKAQLDAFKQDIISGKITVPTK